MLGTRQLEELRRYTNTSWISPRSFCPMLFVGHRTLTDGRSKPGIIRPLLDQRITLR